MTASRGHTFSRREMLGSTAAAGAAAFAAPHSIMADETRLPRNVILSGKGESPAELVELKAGPLTALFDPSLAFLRYVRFGDEIVLLGLYSAVRDHNWGTIAPRVHNQKIELTEGGFAVTFDVECAEGDIDFFWSGKITGQASGVIRFEMEGEARSTFLRNRIGFCVLHAADRAGKPCELKTVDGQTTQGKFPGRIAPNQPYINLRSISHEVAPGVTAEVLMEGDTFEMEDQRNWTDASYKTYCTPLAKPFPAEVKKGSKIHQAVSITLSGAAKTAAVVAKRTEVELEINGKGQPMPRLGLGLSNAAPLANETEKQRLRKLAPAHLRVDLDLADPDWKGYLRRAVTEEGRFLKAPLEMAVFITDNADAELQALAAVSGELRAKVVRWLVIHKDEPATSDKWVAIARKHLDENAGGGTNANFTELNRNRPSEHRDVICYSTNPQVHAFDNLSLVETFAGLRETVKTARGFSGDAKLAISPVTLKPRFNPVATAAAAPDPKTLPKPVDIRQMSLFGAGWTLGSIQALAESGVDSLTYYETLGWQGVMETASGSRLPGRFRSIPGAVFPLYHVLADIAECGMCEVLPVAISDPLKVAALALWPAKGEGATLLLANLTPEVQYLRITHEVTMPRLSVWTLDEHSAIQAMTKPEEFRETPEQGLYDQSPIEIAMLPYAYMKLAPN
jgi:D-apionolactonase